jgi:hypothetical protein
MRRLFQIICIGCVATIIISCGNSGSQAKSGEEANQVEQKANAGTPTTPSFTPTTPIVEEDDSIKKETIKKRIEQIYSDVFAGEDKSSTQFDVAYLSKDFLDIYNKALAKGAENREAALDHDLWHQAKNWRKMSMKVLDVSLAKSHSRYAYADIDLIDGSRHNQVSLVMLKEDGIWKITNMNEDKDRLKEYLAASDRKDSQQARTAASDIWAGQFRISGGVKEDYPESFSIINLQRVSENQYSGNISLMVGRWADNNQDFDYYGGLLQGSVHGQVSGNNLTIILDDYQVKDGRGDDYISDFVAKGNRIFQITNSGNYFTAKPLGKMDFIYSTKNETIIRKVSN